jgi:hypothetical protein
MELNPTGYIEINIFDMKFDKLYENAMNGMHPVPETGCGWRYLRPKEIIQQGDERYNYIFDEWRPVPPNWIGEECEDEKIRTFRS